MVRTLKRILSLLLPLVMVLCMLPIATFAADTQLQVVVNNAPIRKDPKQESTVIERCAKNTKLEYLRFRINSRLNLWYEVKCSDGSSGYIFSGNVKKPDPNVLACGTLPTQIDISRSLLDKDTCLEKAEEYVDATGMTKEQIAKEIYAHAFCYYGSDSILNNSVKLYLTDAVMCALFPGQCLQVITVTDAIIEFAKYCRKKAECVEIGEGDSIKGIIRQNIYEIIWALPIPET